MTTITGTIRTLKARIDISGDLVQVIGMEVHGDMGDLSLLMKKPLVITIEEEGK